MLAFDFLFTLFSKKNVQLNKFVDETDVTLKTHRKDVFQKSCLFQPAYRKLGTNFFIYFHHAFLNTLKNSWFNGVNEYVL